MLLLPDLQLQKACLTGCRGLGHMLSSTCNAASKPCQWPAKQHHCMVADETLHDFCATVYTMLRLVGKATPI